MAANALEEKINKIRLQNEEIKRRYEEVEADKKNAAKLNALVQMVPSSDWPERKEPPEFTRKETNKSNVKPKPVKEHLDRPQQYLIGGVEGKKIHKFAQGDGPPPDPKYNFLADSEREENNVDNKRDEDKHKGPNKYVRNGPRKRGGGRDGYQKDHRKMPANSRDGHLPEYDAWRAERNRIDEARINRQRTAEGNWRREWDSNKVNIEKESSKKEQRFSSDTSRRDYKEFEKRHQFEVEHSNRGRGGHRNSHGTRNHGHYDNQPYDHQNDFSESLIKGPLSPTDDRTVIATDKSIKVTVNHGNMPVKGPLMSVKVNAPSIAGTGRVGPRQKTRVTYSSQSEAEISTHQIDNFYRQKSFDEKTHFSNAQRTIAPKSPFTSRRKESNKSPYLQRKDMKRDEQSMRAQSDNIAKSPSTQKMKFKDTQKSPQGQMQFFTSSPQGLVSSRGRGQKRLNGAKNTVIKILGHNDNNENTNFHNDSASIDLGDVNISNLTKEEEKDSAEQFSDTLLHVNEMENLKNQFANDECKNEIIEGNVETENVNEVVKEITDSRNNISNVSRNYQEEEVREKIEGTKVLVKNEEVEKNQVETNDQIEVSKGREISKEGEINKEIEESKEMKNEELEESERLQKIETFENTEKTEKNESFEKNEITEKVLKKNEAEVREIEKSEMEQKLSETETKEGEKSKTETKESQTSETEKKEVEKCEKEKKEIEKNETEEKETKSETEEKEIISETKETETKSETEEKEINSETKERETENKTEEKEIKSETKIETEEKKTETENTKTQESDGKNNEIKKNETPKNEGNSEQRDKIEITNFNEKLIENVSTNLKKNEPDNILSKIEICINESNESKIENDHMSKLEIESIENVSKETCELEMKSGKSLENISTEISNEASLPSE